MYLLAYVGLAVCKFLSFKTNYRWNRYNIYTLHRSTDKQLFETPTDPMYTYDPRLWIILFRRRTCARNGSIGMRLVFITITF